MAIASSLSDVPASAPVISAPIRPAQPGDGDVRGRGEGFGHDESAFQLVELGRGKDQSAYPGGFAGAWGERPEGQRVRQPELMTVRKSTWRRRVPR